MFAYSSIEVVFEKSGHDVLPLEVAYFKYRFVYSSIDLSAQCHTRVYRNILEYRTMIFKIKFDEFLNQL